MSALSMQTRIGVPAQVSSFQNRCDLFPGILDEGRSLLRSVAGSVQDLRYQIDFMTDLSKLPMNEQFNASLLDVISVTDPEANNQQKILAYNQILADEMTELSNTIDICERTPKTSTTEVSRSNLASHKNPTHQSIESSLSENSLRIHSYCQAILPTLYLYRTQGSVLQGRIKILMDATIKGYNTSSAEFKTVSSPILAAAELRKNPPVGESSVGFAGVVGGYLSSLWGGTKQEVKSLSTERSSDAPVDDPAFVVATDTAHQESAMEGLQSRVALTSIETDGASKPLSKGSAPLLAATAPVDEKKTAKSKRIINQQPA